MRIFYETIPNIFDSNFSFISQALAREDEKYEVDPFVKTKNRVVYVTAWGL